jgi:DNA repair protein RadC
VLGESRYARVWTAALQREAGANRAIPPAIGRSQFMSNATHNAALLYVRDAATFRPATTEETMKAARTVLATKFRRRTPITSPKAMRDYLRISFGLLEQEVFIVVLLDNRHRVLKSVEMFRGTIDGCAVHSREIVKMVVTCNAAAVVLAHNHPSGIAEPSQADELITQRIKQALALIDVRVLDHLVVGGNEIYSFAERGLL